MLPAKVFLSVFTLLAVFTSHSSAAFLISAYANGSYVGPPSNGTFDTGVNQGGLGTSAFGFYSGVRGFAAVDSTGIHLVSSSSISGSGGAETHAGVSWTDRISVGGPASPEYLRVVFFADGVIELANTPGSTQATSRVSLTANRASIDAQGNGSQFQSDLFVRQSIDANGQVVVDNFSNFNISIPPGGAFVQWDMVFYLRKDSQGAYDLDVLATAVTSGFNASASAAFGNTIRLTSVTNPDGSALSGPVTFESGYQLPTPANAVPAPPNVLLAAVGVVSLFGGVRVRRRLGYKSAA